MYIFHILFEILYYVVLILVKKEVQALFTIYPATHTQTIRRYSELLTQINTYTQIFYVDNVNIIFSSIVALWRFLDLSVASASL